MYRHRHGAPELAARRHSPPGVFGATHPRWSPGLGAGLLLLLWAPAGSAQQHEVVSSSIEVSDREASLRLEFANGQTLAVDFADGTARLNGESLGPFTPGGASDQAWRGLLGSVQSLAGQRLAQGLDQWSPDAALPEADLRLLRSIEEAFDAAFAAAEPPPRQNAPPAMGGEAVGVGQAAAILGRDAEFLRAWAAAVEGISFDETRVRIGTDYTIPEGTSVDGSVIHLDGLLGVRGHVRGHVIVMNGAVALAAGSRVDGDIRVLDSEIADAGAAVAGERVDLRLQLEEREERLRNRIRADALSQAQRRGGSSPVRGPAYYYRVQDAAQGVLGTGVAFVVLGALALLLSVLGGHRVRSVVGELSSNPMGSTLVGFAGGYAVLPIFLLGIAALTVTVIGIPALLLWVPLFPLVVSLAFFAGFVGAAEHIGGWVLGLGLGWLERFDASRPFNARLAGLATLLLPFAVGSIFIALPLIDWVAGVLFVVGTLACVVAAVAGFGAVLITRGGTVPVRWSGKFTDGDPLDGEDWPTEEKVP